jgi:hypothetical protein
MNQAKLKKTVYIQFRGGLGNQLFQYFAGEFLNSTFNVQVKYIYRGKSNPHHKTFSNIDSFYLKSDFVHYYSLKFFFILLKSVLRAPTIIKMYFTSKLTIKNWKSKILFDKIYDEKALSFQKEVELLNTCLSDSKSRVFYLRGLFMNFGFFDSQPPKNLILKNPSNWYQQFIKESSLIKPIILHVRLGNYLNKTRLDHGVLSLEYYRAALNYLRKSYASNEVWVISDQTAKAKILLTPIIDSSFNFRFDSEDKDPAEVLLAMSTGVGLITSNSTFSLWSGKLSCDSSSIVVPHPFYKNFTITNDILGPYFKIKSNWLTQMEINKLL